MSDINVRSASRVQTIASPQSLVIMARVQELRDQGVDIINFGSRGDTPRRAKDAAIAMLNNPGAAAYTDKRGLSELRKAIALKLRRDNDISADPNTEIVVSAGGMEAIFSTLLALVDRGDEVLITDPSWHGFEPMVRLAGATPIRVPIRSDAFRLPVGTLNGVATPRTRLLVLCNPDNPTGAVLDRQELEGIARFACERDLLVLVDEAYENFVYDGRKHVSLASLESMRRRTVTVQTTSKIYNMFGWRVGWLFAPSEIVASILSVHSWVVGCPASFAQAGAAAALAGLTGQGDRPIQEIVRRYQEQRDAIVEGLRKIPGVTCALPEGAYFVFPNFSAYGMPSDELCQYLLESGGVATTSGSGFGPSGEGHLRLVFNSPVEEITVGISRIAKALSKLKR